MPTTTPTLSSGTDPLQERLQTEHISSSTAAELTNTDGSYRLSGGVNSTIDSILLEQSGADLKHHVWEGPLSAAEAVVAGHPLHTTTNDDGELVIGLSEATGKAVYDDATCCICPDWNEGVFAARGFNACTNTAVWGSDAWLTDPVDIDEGFTLENSPQRGHANWEDNLPSFDASTALSYMIHEPRELHVRHADGYLSDVHVVRFDDKDSAGVATDAAAYAAAPPDSPQTLTAALRSTDPNDRIGYQQAADKEMNGHITNGTWIEWVGPVPEGKQPLRTKLFLLKRLVLMVNLRHTKLDL
jgi:hypothetical protein